MNFKVEVTTRFKKQTKHLLRKYPSLKQELEVLFNSLSIDPKQGVSLGHDCFKIRLAIESKGRGKSGGARIITHLQITNTTIYLITIYNKSEQSNILDKEISEFVKDL
jgi:mRNA-degrading endonuclease RelE of RelBE toxin-antitoxin system